MGNRYGRNKKRRHIEEIKNLLDSLRSAELKAEFAEQRSRNAKQEALKYYMENSGLMRESIERISYELGRAVGKELEPHARKMFETSQRIYNDSPIKFSVHDSFVDRKIEVIRGEVRPFAYSIALC